MDLYFETAIRNRLKAQHKERSTANAYCFWVKRYFQHCKANGIGRETKAEKAVELFLTKLAVKDRVASSTQNQALSALCYFYGDLHNRPLENVDALRAKRAQRIRDVCDESDLRLIFRELSGESLLACQLMYGAGLRIGETIKKLRLKDLNFKRKQIHIWAGKNKKDRIVQFPELLHDAVSRQIDFVRLLWKQDVAEKRNGVSLPDAWDRKSPSSRLELGWYYLFPSRHYSPCPDTGKMLRHHRDPGGIAKDLKSAVQKSGVTSRITAHCLRHSYATHSAENGTPLHVLQQLMGHTNIETTETYLHVAKDGATAAQSPIEFLENPKVDRSAEIHAMLLELLAKPNIKPDDQNQNRRTG